MYTQLTQVLYANVGAWLVLVLLIIAVQLGGAPFPWRLAFLVTTFWDILYLAVLIAVAWIWSPGPESFQYAYYEQSAGAEAVAWWWA
jgi:hypothetical protein